MAKSPSYNSGASGNAANTGNADDLAEAESKSEAKPVRNSDRAEANAKARNRTANEAQGRFFRSTSAKSADRNDADPLSGAPRSTTLKRQGGALSKESDLRLSHQGRTVSDSEANLVRGNVSAPPTAESLKTNLPATGKHSVRDGNYAEQPTSFNTQQSLSINAADNYLSELPLASMDGADQALERIRQNQQRQIYLLETDLRKSARLLTTLCWSALGTLVFCALLLVATFVPNYRPYTHYFLIGNGVMGAIILWHLVEAVLVGKRIQGRR
jgi:hypothetical protein